MSEEFYGFDDPDFDGNNSDDLDPDLYDDCGNPYPECGWQPGHGCAFAGSEDCDFECPNREEMIRDLQMVGRRKRKS